MDYEDMLVADAKIALKAANIALEHPVGARARVLAADALLFAYPRERIAVIGKLLGFPVPDQAAVQVRAAQRTAVWVRELRQTKPYIWDEVLGAIMSPEYGDRL